MGLIPAHAGKTRCATPAQFGRRAHPRSRGENASQSRADDLVQGSSPLTRGKPSVKPGCSTRAGLIPAHAGKTSVWRVMAGTPAAHPRSRGENSPPSGRGMRTTGSSPLTRGKRCPLGCACGGCRLIPAHAGKTRRNRRAGKGWRAHPRSRGENALGITTCTPAPGSSPLTRGKRATREAPALRSGLIPAHAGKTSTGGACARSRWAHPRSRGENSIMPAGMAVVRGSSPLTRGKLAACQFGGGRLRLIPAHAGKTRRAPP